MLARGGQDFAEGALQATADAASRISFTVTLVEVDKLGRTIVLPSVAEHAVALACVVELQVGQLVRAHGRTVLDEAEGANVLQFTI